MFCGNFREAVMNEIEIKDYKPDTFRVLLQWLFGQPFEKAI
jgi:hypothetical protein